MRAQRLVDLAVGLAPALIAPLEINRAKAELQSLKQTREVAIRDWMVASAALAEILLLDPETLLEPVEPPFGQVTLIPGDQTAAELVPIAINNRPEIASQRELLAAANQRLKQEKKRPFLPNLLHPQHHHDHRLARRRQPVRRSQRQHELQRPSGGEFRGGGRLAASERGNRQYRPHPPAPRRARPGVD